MDVSMVDHWDGIGFLGCSGILAGVGVIYWPAALILGGSALLGLYFLRERAHAARPTARR